MKQDLKKVTISGFTICTIKRKEENYLVLKRKTSHNERNLLLADGGGFGSSSPSSSSSRIWLSISIVLKCLVFFWLSTHRLPREELPRHRLSIGFVIGLNSISRDYKSRPNF